MGDMGWLMVERMLIEIFRFMVNQMNFFYDISCMSRLNTLHAGGSQCLRPSPTRAAVTVRTML